MRTQAINQFREGLMRATEEVAAQIAEDIMMCSDVELFEINVAP
jgi:hypothetical protein